LDLVAVPAVGEVVKNTDTSNGQTRTVG